MFRSARKRRRSFETLSIESLENRAMMSADLGLAVAEGIRQIEWNGHQVAARAEQWVWFS